MHAIGYFLLSTLAAFTLVASTAVHFAVPLVLIPVTILALFQRPVLLATILVVLMLLSNLFLGMLSEFFTKEDMRVAQALNFYYLIFLGGVTLLAGWAGRIEFSSFALRVRWVVVCALVLVLLYYAYGIHKNGFVAATIYLRFFLYPFIVVFFISCLARLISLSAVQSVLIGAFYLAVFLLIFEIVAPSSYYAALNSVGYFENKGGYYYGSPELLAESTLTRLFNSQIFAGIMVHRPFGLTYHNISGAYFFAVIGLYFMTYKRYFTLAMAFLCVCFMGSKGPLLLLLLGGGSYFMWRNQLYRQYAFAITLLLTPIALVFVGLNTYDPHSFSLMSSLLHFPSNLFGKGLGFGGVLTTGTNYSVEIGDINGDSGGAILLNMFGVMGGVLYWLYFSLLRKLYEPFSSSRQIIMLFIMGNITLINAILQEEGFSPYSIGLIFLLLTLHAFKAHEAAQQASSVRGSV